MMVSSSQRTISLSKDLQQIQRLSKRSETGRNTKVQGKRRSLSATLVVLCCTAALLPLGFAFPRESIGWSKAYRGPAYRQETQQLQPNPEYCAARLQLLQNNLQSSVTLLRLSGGSSEGNSAESSDNSDSDKERKWRLGKKEGRRFRRAGSGRGFARRGGANSTTAVMDAPEALASPPSEREIEMAKRMTQLEHLVAKQTVEIKRLQEKCDKFEEASSMFSRVVELLREAGLQTDHLPNSSSSDTDTSEEQNQQTESELVGFADNTGSAEDAGRDIVYEYFDDTEIFGEAPSSVTDAADAAGAAILAGLLGGKQTMLVDVRDSELSRDAETLVKFIELAILPVAAGLEGLRSNRNRVKIVFPTVSQLLEYRRTMALAAPEVVALSTLGFDPVEERDNIVVIVAPAPDDEEGLQAMNELLKPLESNNEPQIAQPVVVLNHHMVPLSGPAADFDVMYHLRLLSVQYMSGDRADALFEQFEEPKDPGEIQTDATNTTGKPNEELLEAAMKHAHEAGVHHGMTRAMVIRAYPKPWHVFVDVSPDTDADFVVADTFTEEPNAEEVNNAIVECLEGSEREDELVAQQMQQALDMDLDMKNENLDMRDKNGIMDAENEDNKEDGEDDDEFDDLWDLWTEESV